MSLASFNAQDGTMTWLGIGNVESILVHADSNASPAHESPILRGGVVGGQLPLLRAAIVQISPGDLLIFATDGIRSGFLQGLPLSESPQQLAERILAGYYKGNDDALALVACYKGLSH